MIYERELTFGDIFVRFLSFLMRLGCHNYVSVLMTLIHHCPNVTKDIQKTHLQGKPTKVNNDGSIEEGDYNSHIIILE